MNFEGLLKQINELERAKRREEMKLAEVKAANEAKEVELQMLAQDLSDARTRIGELGEEIASLKVEERTLRTNCEQLVESLKSTREETKLVKASVEVETQATKKKREELSNTLRNMIRDLRAQQLRYQEAVNRMEAPLDAQPQMSLDLGIAAQSVDREPKDNAEKDDNDSSSAQSQIDELNGVIQELQEKEKQTSLEFNGLEEYTGKLEAMLQQIRGELSKLSTFHCPQCDGEIDVNAYLIIPNWEYTE